MKKLLVFASMVTALATVSAADYTVKLSQVHLCCASCVKSVEKAVSGVANASVQADKENGTVAITAPDQETAQKATDAVIHAGYFGTSSDPAIKVKDKSGAKKGKIQSLTIKGVHLCCGKCVKAVNEALSKVKGVEGNTAAKDAETFEVTGNFKAKAVFAALNKAGFAGKAAQ